MIFTYSAHLRVRCGILHSRAQGHPGPGDPGDSPVPWMCTMSRSSEKELYHKQTCACTPRVCNDACKVQETTLPQLRRSRGAVQSAAIAPAAEEWHFAFGHMRNDLSSKTAPTCVLFDLAGAAQNYHHFLFSWQLRAVAPRFAA